MPIKQRNEPSNSLESLPDSLSGSDSGEGLIRPGPLEAGSPFFLSSRRAQAEDLADRGTFLPEPTRFTHMPVAFEGITQEVASDLYTKYPDLLPENPVPIAFHPVWKIDHYWDVGKDLITRGALIQDQGIAEVHGRVDLCGMLWSLDEEYVKPGYLNHLYWMGGIQRGGDTEPNDDCKMYMQRQAAITKTVALFRQNLASFIERHVGDLDMSCYEDHLTRMTRTPLEERRGFYYQEMDLYDIPPKERDLFIREVMLPSLEDDPLFAEFLGKEMEETIVHELIAHPTFGIFEIVERMFSPQEAELMTKLLPKMNDKVLGSNPLERVNAMNIAKSHSMDGRDERFQEDVIAINHDMVKRANDHLSSVYGHKLARKLHFLAGLYGLDETFTRALTGCITGRPEFYEEAICHYAYKASMRLYEGDKGVKRLMERIEKEGISRESLQKIIDDEVYKVAKELGFAV
jgi:hypothetical protein